MRTGDGPLGRIDDLARHGGRLAVTGADGVSLSYRELDGRVERRVAELGRGRRLVLAAATGNLESLITYLAGLRAGHVILLTGGDEHWVQRWVHRYRPDTVVRHTGAGDAAGAEVEHRQDRPAHRLHPDLTVLLSTSGSTGSPKLVRLSRDNLEANAESIAGYLPIRADDRAALTLPVHYCYGLSVVNSNLVRGASLLLPDRSVCDPAFWDTFRAHGATSLHGVPHTFDLLDAVGFADMHLPALRYLTQAGGRWAPDAVRRYGRLAARRGWELFVMYGQTEATARMAYLPPGRVEEAPDAIGIPVPGGAFTLRDRGPDGVGELVYRGPNVMLGYAHGPDDLARGRTVHALRTGDLAHRRADGLHVLAGRRDRRLKLFGHRVDLDRVEDILAADGITAASTGDDTELVVAAVSGPGCPPPATIQERLGTQLGLPPTAVRVVAVPELPRTPAGKIDTVAVAALTRRADTPCPGEEEHDPGGVASVYRSLFPGQPVGADDTFIGLGGDSLRYVQASVSLQRLLGTVPPGWPDMPVAELARLPRRRPGPVRLETPAVLRAVAMVLIVGSHVGAYHVLGGAHVLLAVAGWACARFVLTPARHGSTSSALLGTAVRIAVPSALWIATRAAVQDDVSLRNALLLNYLVDPHVWGYWFVETLTQVLLLLAVLFALPPISAAHRRWPFAFPGVLLVAALSGRLFPDTGNEFSDRLMSPHLVLWLFILGWLTQRATTTPRRLLVAALDVVLVPTFFPTEPARGAVATLGVLLVLVPTLPVPRPLARPIGALGAASMTVYLTHYALYPSLHALPATLNTATCLIVGVGAHTLLARLWRRTVHALARTGRTRPAGVGAALGVTR